MSDDIHKLRMRIIAGAVLVMALAVTCKVIPDFHLYPGPERPLEEVAYLFFCPCPERCEGQIMDVDGVPVPKCNQLFPGKACLISLLPGEHTVRVFVWGREVIFKFNAEAAQSYDVRCISKDLLLSGPLHLAGQVFWLSGSISLSKHLFIEDINTWKKVGEVKVVEK